MKKENTLNLRYFAKNMRIVVGLVLVWRGTWYVLDGIDIFIFKGDHFFTAIAGILIGLAVLYIPDRDLKELQKL